jgi:hypothetical protein
MIKHVRVSGTSRCFYVRCFYVRCFYVRCFYVRCFYVRCFYVRTSPRLRIAGQARWNYLPRRGCCVI